MIKKNYKISGNRIGFTLVELVVVVAILGIITAIAIPTYYGITEKSNLKIFETNHNIIVSGINMYVSAHNGAFPPSGDALVTGKYILVEAGEYTSVTYNEDDEEKKENITSFFLDQPTGATYELNIKSNGFTLTSKYKTEERTYSRSK